MNQLNAHINSIKKLVYIAPELLDNLSNINNNYSENFYGNIWALGVTIYELLGGNFSLFQELENFLPYGINSLTREFPLTARSFIKRCLKVNIKDKMTLEEANNHIWIGFKGNFIKGILSLGGRPRKVFWTYFFGVISSLIML